MLLLSRIFVYTSTIMAGLLISNAPLLAQYRATIDDLLHDPEKYYDLTIRITGKVVNVFTDGYTIQNDIGLLIDVISKKTPIMEEKYDITVTVEKNPDSLIPNLTEIKRSKQGEGFSWLVIFFTVVFLGVMSIGGG